MMTFFFWDLTKRSEYLLEKPISELGLLCLVVDLL